MRSENSRNVWREDALAAVDIDDALVVSEVRRGRGDRALRNALRQRLALEIGEPLIEGPAGAAWRGGVRGAGQNAATSDNVAHGYAATAHFKYQSKISSPVQYTTPSKRRA